MRQMSKCKMYTKLLQATKVSACLYAGEVTHVNAEAADVHFMRLDLHVAVLNRKKCWSFADAQMSSAAVDPFPATGFLLDSCKQTKNPPSATG